MSPLWDTPKPAKSPFSDADVKRVRDSLSSLHLRRIASPEALELPCVVADHHGDIMMLRQLRSEGPRRARVTHPDGRMGWVVLSDLRWSLTRRDHRAKAAWELFNDVDWYNVALDLLNEEHVEFDFDLEPNTPVSDALTTLYNVASGKPVTLEDMLKALAWADGVLDD